jgi:uncharacterized membrane protein YphA (DoxX/SURF4 family)
MTTAVPPATDRAAAPAWVVVPLRLYVGAAFLSAASNKVGSANWSHWPEWMAGVVTGRLPDVTPLYRPFLTAVVAPHVTFFAPFVALTEIAVGVALLLGGATRLAAAVGILLTANYFLLDGVTVVDVSNDAAFLVGLAILVVTAAGRVLGLDTFLSRRWPRSKLW